MVNYLEKVNESHVQPSVGSTAFAENRLLTMKEAALYLNVKRSKMYELIHEPDFPLVALSAREYRVFLFDLQAWVLSKKTRS